MKPVVMKKKSSQIATYLKSLAHPQRLHILCYLAEGERTVSEIQDETGISQSQVSQFLSRMKVEGMLGSRRDGRSSLYKITHNPLKKLLKFLTVSFAA